MASLPSRIVTLTFTSVSLFSPWLRTSTSNERSSESGTVAEAPGTSATPPSVTVPSPLPWSPGAALVAGAATGPSQAGDLIGHEVGIGPLTSGTNSSSFCFGTLTSSAVLVPERLLRLLEAVLEQHVAGEEHLHHRGDVAGALAAFLVREGARESEPATAARLSRRSSRASSRFSCADETSSGTSRSFARSTSVADSLRRPFTTLAASTASSWSPEPPRSSNSWLPSSFD